MRNMILDFCERRDGLRRHCRVTTAPHATLRMKAVYEIMRGITIRREQGCVWLLIIHLRCALSLKFQQVFFSAPSVVQPAFGMPGGGLERTASGIILVRIIEVYK